MNEICIASCVLTSADQILIWLTSQTRLLLKWPELRCTVTLVGMLMSYSGNRVACSVSPKSPTWTLSTLVIKQTKAILITMIIQRQFFLLVQKKHGRPCSRYLQPWTFLTTHQVQYHRTRKGGGHSPSCFSVLYFACMFSEMNAFSTNCFFFSREQVYVVGTSDQKSI